MESTELMRPVWQLSWQELVLCPVESDGHGVWVRLVFWHKLTSVNMKRWALGDPACPALSYCLELHLEHMEADEDRRGSSLETAEAIAEAVTEPMVHLK